jgi:fumarate hydratase class II
MNSEFRIESDSMGSMRVPASAYYGAQTARAVENFPISNLRFPRQFIRAVGLIKKHAAKANAALVHCPLSSLNYNQPFRRFELSESCAKKRSDWPPTARFSE